MNKLPEQLLLWIKKKHLEETKSMGSSRFISTYMYRLILSIFTQESCLFLFFLAFLKIYFFSFPFSIPICSPISRAGAVGSTAVADSSYIYPLYLFIVLRGFVGLEESLWLQEPPKGQSTHWLLPLANTKIHLKHHFSPLSSPALQAVLDPHTFLLCHHRGRKKKKIQILFKEHPFSPCAQKGQCDGQLLPSST